MEKLIFPLIMFPCAASFTALGIFAWKRKKPMWFWSGSEVKAWQLTDVAAYNRANGIMWLVFSLGFWAAAILGCFHVPAAGILVMVTCLAGIPGLVIAYNRIYKKYKA